MKQAMKIFATRYYYLLVILASIACVAAMAQGTTYNFYFNNVDQAGGDGTTASPTMTVNPGADGKSQVEGSGDLNKLNAPTQNPVNETAPALKETVPPASEGEPQVPLAQPLYEDEHNNFRLMFGVAGAGAYPAKYGPAASGFNASFAYFPSKYFGLGATFLQLRHEVKYEGYSYSDWSSDVLGEVHVVPLHISLFGVKDALEMELSLGVNQLAVDVENKVSLHAGTRFNVNFGSSNSFLVSAGARGNLGFWMADAGVGFRF